MDSGLWQLASRRARKSRRSSRGSKFKVRRKIAELAEIAGNSGIVDSTDRGIEGGLLLVYLPGLSSPDITEPRFG